MSNIYIQEPPTNGKVLFKTTVGDIDVELWSKETPKACRNFVQLCLEGYYDGTAFHRVVKEFIVQGGDPTDSGEGGESVYGAPFKDEFHSRLRFVRRGLVAMANGGKLHDNGSQFFFTMAATPELQNKHTIFGKVVGDTLYNMLKLQEVEVDEASERPPDPHKVLSVEVLNNPFDDIIPRQLTKRQKKDNQEEKKIKSKSKATKNFSLLSFGDEAEDDEEQVDKATESFRGKSKSIHDLTDDPRLSSIPAVEQDQSEDDKRKKKLDSSPELEGTKKTEPTEETLSAATEPTQDSEVRKKSASPEDNKKPKPDIKIEEKRKSRFEPLPGESLEEKRKSRFEPLPGDNIEDKRKSRFEPVAEVPDDKRKSRFIPPPELSMEKRKSRFDELPVGNEKKKSTPVRELDDDVKKRKAESIEEEVKKANGKSDAKEEVKKRKVEKVGLEPDHDSRKTEKGHDSKKRKPEDVDNHKEDRKRKLEDAESHKEDRKRKLEDTETLKEDRKRKVEETETHKEDRKRKPEESEIHKEDRKRKSKEAEEDDRKKRKGENREDDSARKRKKEELIKEDAKKKGRTGGFAGSQPVEEDKNSKDDARRKLKKGKEDPLHSKEPKILSLDEAKQNRMDELKKEQRKLQRDIKEFKKRANPDDKVKAKPEDLEPRLEKKTEEAEETEETDLLAMVKKERQKYKTRKKELGRNNREEVTLAMLNKFKSKLSSVHRLAADYDDPEEDKDDEEEAEDPSDITWMRHKLRFDDASQKTKVIDANIYDIDRYELHDPRNPLTQRRREASKRTMRDKR